MIEYTVFATVVRGDREICKTYGPTTNIEAAHKAASNFKKGRQRWHVTIM